MSQRKRTINTSEMARVTNDPCIDHALWRLSMVLSDIAKQVINQDEKDPSSAKEINKKRNRLKEHSEHH